MTQIANDLAEWDEMSEDEREELRALVHDLGGQPTDDEDEYE